MATGRVSKKSYVRRGAGPVYYSWSPSPSNFTGKGGDGTANLNIKCDNIIDNVVTYVYDVLPNGNHLAYVFCDYVV